MNEPNIIADAPMSDAPMSDATMSDATMSDATKPAPKTSRQRVRPTGPSIEDEHAKYYLSEFLNVGFWTMLLSVIFFCGAYVAAGIISGVWNPLETPIVTIAMWSAIASCGTYVVCQLNCIKLCSNIQVYLSHLIGLHSSASRKKDSQLAKMTATNTALEQKLSSAQLLVETKSDMPDDTLQQILKIVTALQQGLPQEDYSDKFAQILELLTKKDSAN